ncbi:MAG: amidohydrolase family protein, partial [Sphingobium sp.]
SLNLVREGHVTLSQPMRLLSANPARLLGLDAGTLAAGAPADIIFIDPETPWRIDSRKMAAAAGNTPFDGIPVQGRVRRVMKGGIFY